MSANYSPEIVTDGAVFVGDARDTSTATAGSRLYDQANVDSTDVKLLIHGNEGSGQSFTDSSLSNHTITANGTVAHSTTQSKFDGGSMYFGGSADYLQIDDSADWNFGAGDYTFDCWIYPTAVNIYGGIINQGEDASNYQMNSLEMYTDGTGNIRWLIRNSSPTTFVDIKTPSGSIVVNNWYHIAAVRYAGAGGSATSYKIYINGIESASATSGTTLMDLPWPMYIGVRDKNNGDQQWYFEGYMDEVRITKGVALWTQDFTPPARRDTLSISDGMMYNGSCISLDGGDEYVNCGDASDLTVTTGSFTLIGYIRNNTIGGYDVVVQKGNAGHGTNPGYRLRWENDNTLDFICTQSSSYAEATLQSLGALSQDVWYQVAVTRNAGLLSVYIDGVLNNSLASAITGTLTTSENFIIGRNNYGSGSGYFDGQMADWKFFNVALSADQVKELYDNSKLIIPSGVSQSNLKLWLPLSEGIGTICYDGSGNGNHGTFTNADSSGDWLTGQTGCPQLVEGYNRPMLFDGNLSAGDHVDCGASNALITGTTLSISAWVKSDNTTKSRVFQAQKGAGSSSYSLAMNNNGGSAAAGYVSFLTYPGSGSHNYLNYDASLDDGAWHHLACSTTASAQKLYVDGALVASASATFSNTTTADIANIGSVGGASEFASGLINEVVLYDSELSLAQVQALAATGPNGGPLPPDPMSLSNSSDIIAYWRNDGNYAWRNRGPQVIKNFTDVATDPLNDTNSVGSWTHNGTSLTSVTGGREGFIEGAQRVAPRYRLLFDSGTNMTVNSIVAVTEGKTYKVSAYYMAGTVSSAMLRVDGPGLSTPVSIGPFTTNTTSWTNKTSTFTATATANVTIELHNRATGTQYFDDVTLVESGSALDGTVSGSPDALLFKQGYNGSASTSTGRDTQGFPLLTKNVGEIGCGGSGYVSIAGLPAITTKTVAFWVQIGAGVFLGNSDNVVVGLGSGWQGLDIVDDGGTAPWETASLRFHNSAGSNPGAARVRWLERDQWYYLAYTEDGTTNKYYQNGRFMTSTTSGGATVSATTIALGARTSLDYNYSGAVSGLQLYNRALSESELLQNYNAQRSRFT